MMNFHQILEQVATRPETRGNAIGDGQFSCAYSELPSRLDEVTVFLDGKRIGGDECLAVECINSVSGALLLLALWRRGASFVLTPPGVNNETKPTPGFCRYKLTVRHGAPLSAADSIQVESNPDFNGEKIPAGKLLLRTSGSIGASKIVVHDQLKLIGNAGNCVRKYNFNPASRAVIPVPVAHMYGFGAEFLPAILAGASIDLQEKTNVLTYLDREKRFRPTIAFVTPAICEMLLKAYKTPRTHYDVMVTSGQRIGEDVFRALDPLLGGRLVNQYGSTEMGATAACDPGEPLDLRVTSIGKPMEGVELRLE